MAVKISAGLLMYRVRDGQLEVFLAHPGGPYSFRKDEDTWSIPKGEVEINESLLEAAIREFTEEVGFAPQGELTPLGSIRQKSGKIVHGWAFAGDWTASSQLVSSPFELEWPPGSGRICQFPEVDRVGFFNFAEARRKMKAAQQAFLGRLETLLITRGVLPASAANPALSRANSVASASHPPAAGSQPKPGL